MFHDALAMHKKTLTVTLCVMMSGKQAFVWTAVSSQHSVPYKAL